CRGVSTERIGTERDTLLGRVLAQRRNGVAGVHGVALIVRPHIAVPRVSTTLSDDIDDAAERAAVLSLDAAGLHLDFLDELERSVSRRLARDHAAGLHTVDEVGVLSRSATVDLEASLQGFVPRTGGEGNHGLIGTTAGSVVDLVFGYGCLLTRGRHVDDRRF